MTHEVIRHLLDDYVTGELAEDARGPVADHIAACAICGAEVENLNRIFARAAELPRSIDPPAEAWSKIRSAIERDEQAVALRSASARSTPRRRFFFTAAAAAVVIAMLSSAGTVLYLNTRQSASDSTNSRTASTSADAATPAALAAFTMEENNYLRNASMLQDVLDQQSGSLAPETVAQLKASIRTIDEAILEARNALARDPANKILAQMVFSNYRQKVDLLRRTAEITRGS
ncbi:MAG: hypothetical protein ABI469_04640 [Gemmatimonadales bacterium]